MRSALLLPKRSEGKTKVIRQQYLPFTVLKPSIYPANYFIEYFFVATVPTVYGIETYGSVAVFISRHKVATTPTACGIETGSGLANMLANKECCNSTYRLRYAPKGVRQQRSKATMRPAHLLPERSEGKTKVISNSTYRLRYAPKGARQQRSKATMRSVHLLPERREGKTKVVKS